MESEDDFDWEEVPVPEHEQHIEITLQPKRKEEPPAKKRPAGISYAERLSRLDCHKIHTIALLGNARIRNKWLNDQLLHARLLSLTPLYLQNGFALIHKSRIPDQNQRGRMFEAAVRNLAEWWANTFFDVALEGHIRNRTYNDVQSRLIAEGIVLTPPSRDTPVAGSSSPLDEVTAIISFMTSQSPFLDIDTLMDILDDEGETIRSSNSLMKHTLMRCGSRDTSAQLFTALCRALGIPARLVVSLQSVPWQSSVGKPKPKYPKKTNKEKEKEKAQVEVESNEDENDMEEVDIPPTPSSSKGKGKAKAMSEPDSLQVVDHHSKDPQIQPKSAKARGTKPPIKLRKQKNKRSKTFQAVDQSDPPDPLLTPPVFWTEVFSRPDGRWLPVDPIRAIVNKRKVFDPTPTPSSSAISELQRSKTHRENRMMYVLAFEEDGYARDVTRRYAREYSSKVAKVQAGGGGKGRQLWWQVVVNLVSRPYRLHRDDVEDEELDIAQLMEGMPTTLGGFKDHPLYVLERHLKQNEVLHPPPPETSEVGKFRGESVYPRSVVITLKSAETWMRTEGRSVKPGCQPLKMTKLRASTVGKMREVEILREAGATEGDTAGSEVMQGLYARSQTQPFVPDPVIDEIVPKNNFGNIDLYVPSMLPKGAVHIPFKGVAKIARKLGFDFAEAVTGFEFKKRRAFPIIEGIVVAQENESTLLEAYWEAERIAEEKSRARREDQVIKRWARLIQGLRIRQRLQNQYANKSEDAQNKQNILKEPSAENVKTDINEERTESHTISVGAGFLVEADDVVKAFSLPKYQHVSLPFNPISGKRQTQQGHDDDGHEDQADQDLTVPEYIIHDMDVDSSEVQKDLSLSTPSSATPMTMQELAEAMAKKQTAEQGANGPEPEQGAQKAITVVDNTRTLRSQKNASRKRTPVALKSGKSAAQASRSRGSTRARVAVDRRRTSRKRRRTGSEDEDDSHVDSDEPPLEADDVESDHNEGDDQPSSKKRARTTTSSVSAPAQSSRVLRPRRGMTQARIEEKQAQEDACSG